MEILDHKYKKYDIYKARNEILSNLKNDFNNVDIMIKFFIIKFGIKIITKDIISHDKFIKYLLYIQDEKVYNLLASKYKLLVYRFLDFCENNENEINNFLKPPNIFIKYNSKFINLWKYVYNTKEEYVKDLVINYENILEVINNLEKLKNKNIITYNVNKVCKILIYLYHCRIDYLKEINDDEQEDFININLQELTNINENNIKNINPLFKESVETESYKLNIIDYVNEEYKSESSGYLWYNDNIFDESKIVESNNPPEKYIDKFVTYTFNLIKYGIINKQLIEWFFIFQHNRLSLENKIYLFSIIVGINSNKSGLISDILKQENIIFNELNETQLNKIFEELNNSNYLYKPFEKKLDPIMVKKNLNKKILDLFNQNKVDIRGLFYDFNISLSSLLNLNDLYFDENYFSVLLDVSPLKSNLENINMKISLKKESSKNKLDIEIINMYKTFNTLNLLDLSENINKEINYIKIIKNLELTTIRIDELNQDDVDYNFNKGVIKMKILEIFLEYSFIPSDYYTNDIVKDFNEFVKKRNDMSNILNGLIYNDCVKKDIITRMKENKSVYFKLFHTFLLQNSNLY